MKNKYFKFKAFTLVELIIVITILAILSTIAFVSFNGYVSKSRDSNRLYTIKEISKSLDINKVVVGSYPKTDNTFGTGQILGTTLFKVGEIGDNISQFLKINKTPKDPLSQSNYLYGLSEDGKYYQVAGTMENSNYVYTSQTYADNSNLMAKVEGNYKGILFFSTGSNRYIGNVPSIIFSRTGTYDLILQEPYFVINNGKNIPYYINPTNTPNIVPKTEILEELTGTSTTLTGIIITSSPNIPKIANDLGYPKDIVGYEILGPTYLTNNSSSSTQEIKFLGVTSGYNSICGNLNTGNVVCWGEVGLLTGIEDVGKTSTPLYVLESENTKLSNVKQASGNCALLNDGGVKCWGHNRNGELGNGTTESSKYAVDVLVGPGVKLTGAVGVYGIDSLNCALMNNGGVKCWGPAVSNGNPWQTLYATDILLDSGGTKLTNVKSIIPIRDSTCFILNDNSSKCWGGNNFGELGDGTNNNSDYPVNILKSDGSNFYAKSISGLGRNVCGIGIDDKAYCWGDKFSNKATEEKYSDNSSITGVVNISTNGDDICYTFNDGTGKCEGLNSEGELGNGNKTSSSYPLNVLNSSSGDNLSNLSYIYLGDTYACGLLKTGKVKCWGDNSSGQLGNGTFDSSLYPVDVVMPE